MRSEGLVQPGFVQGNEAQKDGIIIINYTSL